MKHELKVWRTGNSLCIRIPSDVAKQKGIDKGSTIRLDFDDIEVVQ